MKFFEKFQFWRTAFFAAYDMAKKNRAFHGDCVRTLRQLRSVEKSYCDLGLQMESLDREHQILKLRSPTQLNKEYENQVLAVSMGRPDMSPTKLADANAGRDLIQTVNALATSLARSFERAGLITAPKGSPQARLLDEMRNLFDGCGVYNWPRHEGRAVADQQQVARIQEFSGTQKAIDV